MRLKRTGSRFRRTYRRRVASPRKFRRTGLKRKQAGTSVRVQAVSYFVINGSGSNLYAWSSSAYTINSVMQALIVAAPANALANSFDFVALKWAKVAFHCSGVQNLNNADSSCNYPPLQSTVYMDTFNQAAGLGATPALTLSRYPGAVTAIGRCRLSKTFYTASICRRLDMPYWQPTATGAGNYYQPGGSGLLPTCQIACNTMAGTVNSGSPTVGMIRITGLLQFKNVKIG